MFDDSLEGEADMLSLLLFSETHLFFALKTQFYKLFHTFLFNVKKDLTIFFQTLTNFYFGNNMHV